jgi:hypothetical protein
MKENLGPLPETEDDSPGEVEDTPGDVAEDVAEEDDTEDMPPEGDASTEAGDGT